LLVAIAVTGRDNAGDTEVAVAVRAAVVAVIDALEVSERRASELQPGSTAPQTGAGGHRLRCRWSVATGRFGGSCRGAWRANIG